MRHKNRNNKSEDHQTKRKHEELIQSGVPTNWKLKRKPTN